MSEKTRSLLCSAAAALSLLLLQAATAPEARAGTYGDRLVGEGHDFFGAGNFFRASESYRCAVLEEPADGLKKLHFGQSLFALGNYAYAAYNFRRGVRYLGYPDDLEVDVTSRFPSRLAFERSIRDVRRYGGYYPNDPHALTVIAYTAFFAGERGEAQAACRRLVKLDSRDAFAAYILRRIEKDGPTEPRAPQVIVPVAASGARATIAPAVVAREEPRVIEPRRPPPVVLPPGERAGPARTLSREDVEPAIAR